MKYSNIQFKIDQMRKEKMILVLESLLVFIFAFFSYIFISSFANDQLQQYYMSNPNAVDASNLPLIVKYLKEIIYFLVTLATVYFFYAVFESVSRTKRIKDLEEEMIFADDHCGHDCNCHGHGEDEELAKLDEIIAEAIADSKPTKKKSTTSASKKVTKTKTKKTAKKSAAKKTSKKKK